METKNFKHLDFTYLNSLANGNQDFIKEIISVFLSETPIDIAKIEKNLKNKDWKSLRATAHKMKSSILILGINELENIIKQIEEYSAGETNLNLLPDLIQITKKTCNMAIHELEGMN